MTSPSQEYAVRVPARSFPSTAVAARRARRSVAWFMWLVALSIFLTLVMDADPSFGRLHPLGTALVGAMALLKEKSPVRIAYIAAYASGAELAWRITGSAPVYEFGKYLVSGLLVGAMLKHRTLMRSDRRAVLFILLLLPSIILLPGFDRDALSFNLSGPISLGIAAMFFSRIKLTDSQMRTALMCLLAPILGIAALALVGVLQAGSIEFTQNSNLVTSANTGPNQVSSILGLGALAAILLAFSSHRRTLFWLFMIGTSLVLAAQSALTFSRGGIASLFVALLIGSFYTTQVRRARTPAILAILLITALGALVVYPRLNAYTEGQLADRFTDTDLTDRDTILQADLKAFRENPVLGVGPGQSVDYHELLLRRAKAHTEYSRLLAEHGIFGVAALILLFLMTRRRFVEARGSPTKPLVVALTIWALVFMTHSGTRLMAPAFVFGLAAASVPSSISKRRGIEAPRPATRGGWSPGSHPSAARIRTE